MVDSQSRDQRDQLLCSGLPVLLLGRQEIVVLRPLAGPPADQDQDQPSLLLLLLGELLLLLLQLQAPGRICHLIYRIYHLFG